VPGFLPYFCIVPGTRKGSTHPFPLLKVYIIIFSSASLIASRVARVKKRRESAKKKLKIEIHSEGNLCVSGYLRIFCQLDEFYPSFYYFTLNFERPD